MKQNKNSVKNLANVSLIFLKGEYLFIFNSLKVI